MPPLPVDTFSGIVDDHDNILVLDVSPRLAPAEAGVLVLVYGFSSRGLEASEDCISAWTHDQLALALLLLLLCPYGRRASLSWGGSPRLVPG